MNLTFGSLDQSIKGYAEGAALLMSAGPVSDAFIMSNGPRDLLNGPVGSGKTTACIKRALRAAIQTPPMLNERTPDGRPVRRYRLAVWRETYEQLWGTTIKSWQKVLNPDKGIGDWVGAKPRSATHSITFVDGFGPIHFEALFLAFGEDADPDDLGGTEYTDVYLNEQDKLREGLHINLARSIGRYPSRGEIGLPDVEGVIHGRIFGDCNAPAPDTWVYRDWFSVKKPPGYALFRQPGGFHPDAENLKAVGRGYYRQQRDANAHRPWWIRVKIDNEPGYNQEAAVIYPKFSDSLMVSQEPLQVFPEIPVIIGFDGGYTPSACFLQEMPTGQIRLVQEIVISRGDEFMLGDAIASTIATPRFRDCEFYLTGDEATFAGKDLTHGCYADRVGQRAGLKAHEPTLKNAHADARHHVFQEAMERRTGLGEPGFMIDGTHCPTIRRGFNGTFRRHVNKFGEAGAKVNSPDSHVCEAAEYAGGETGRAHARKRRTEREAERQANRMKREGSSRTRYNPTTRKRA